ncbi:hypothetical protein BDE18_3249 [Paracoccus pantotrophus]|uniref:Uncharacterized protein n=1 Tax=Paracoccus pantotrophus TaxID=82367 RepID=A0ABX9SCC2_PARPN|nr:hypothetical protein BDE18_3249 [Paracoccus pantotrophus]
MTLIWMTAIALIPAGMVSLRLLAPQPAAVRARR